MSVLHPKQRLIDVNDLRLDPDNPRFHHLAALEGRTDLSEEDLEHEIAEDPETATLIKAVRKAGVRDPLWVIPDGNGKYLVFEGNRRTTVLRRLLKEGAKPPEGVRFDKVLANVIPEDTPLPEILLQKARLQAGKKDWGPFNEASLTYQLRTEHLLEEEDIAAELQISKAKVKERIENYKLFERYSRHTKDINPKRFAYFAETPPAVKSWLTSTDENFDTYCDLISPISGKQKIRSVATTGGLRDFAKVIEDPEALEYLVEEDTATMKEAMNIVEENDIRRGMPFLNRLSGLSRNLRGISETQVKQLREDAKAQTDLKALERACGEVLDKIKNG